MRSVCLDCLAKLMELITSLVKRATRELQRKKLTSSSRLLIAKPNQTSYRSGCPALSSSEHEINLTAPRLSLLMHATEHKTLPSPNMAEPASGFRGSIYCTWAIKLNDNVQMATCFLFQMFEYNKLHDAEGFKLYHKLKSHWANNFFFMFACVSRMTRVQFMLF